MTSVLFGDLVGFTSLSESRDQDEVRELLSTYFEESRRIITRYGGSVEKFIGDAVMAVWGVPTSHEDDAERAVRAGLELVAKVTAMGEDLGIADLQMRVGIVTGEVAVTIGAEGQGMVAGDPVNTASRVQTAADAGSVWVDETTRLLTVSAISYVDVGSHTLKGKAEPMPLWSVRAVVAAVGGSQRADGLEAPLTGRARELRMFKELFHASEESATPSLLVVDGEAGVGKSRLAWECFKYADGLQTRTRWHSGRCLAYGEGVAYFALAEAIRGRLAIAAEGQDSDSPERLLQAGLETYVADAAEREWLQPRLEALLGVGSVGTFPREDLFAAWTDFLQRVGAGHPVVLMLDDAQHTDEGLLQFVDHLLATATFSCFVVMLTRPGLLEAHPALATNRRASVVHLTPLSDTDMAELVGGLVSGLPEQVSRALVARAEGIPLFAVETVRSLIDRDLVVPRGGQYVMAEDAPFDLDDVGAPASLQALIAARLDALTASQRRVVCTSSLLGMSFSRDAIEALCPGLDDLDRVLGELVHLQILRLQGNRFSTEFGEYQFVQAVVRQVAYATLSRRDRKAGHLAVVAVLAREDEHGDELAPILAQHYLDAIEALPGDPDVPELTAAAVDLLNRAAARARSLGAPVEAAGHLEAALARVADEEQRAVLQLELASALADASRSAEAAGHAAAATQFFDDHGDDVRAALAAAAHARARLDMLEVTEAQSLAQPRWDALKDRPDAAQALLGLSRVLSSVMTRTNTVDLDFMARRVRLAEQFGDIEAVADAYVGLGVVFTGSGAPRLAGVLQQATVDLAREHHLPAVLGRALLNMAAEAVTQDAYKAIQCGLEGVAAAHQSGVNYIASYAGANLALAQWVAGRWDDLLTLLDTEAETWDQSTLSIRVGLRGFLLTARGEPADLPAANDDETTDIGELAWRALAGSTKLAVAGDREGALAQAREATEQIYGFATIYDDFEQFARWTADLALEQDDFATVDRLIAMITAGLGATTPVAVRGSFHRLTGLRAARDGNAEEAESQLREAIALYGRCGHQPAQARARAELGVVLARQGREAEAEPLLAEARAVLASLGAHAWLERIGQDLPVR
jgi:class 3 adenylate cyclase